ncbi:hypothetical protein ACEWY4_012438 [Coilia grayii]|uniref:AIG1-type G domain-containing protein n=1 Tax=Coilia grayii TaxID=363190 RepID=A0ABD1K0M0_9TELE
MAKIGSRMVQVIDTPGLFDTAVSNEKIREEIGKCITLASPGPHVFLLLLSLGRFTQEERETVEMIQETFGEQSKAYTMVGFTRGEILQEEGTSIETYIKSSHDKLKELIEECGGRYHVFFNKDKNNQHQVSSLLEKIDKMVIKNKGRFYSTAMFQETEAKIRAREMKLLQKRVEELKQSSEDVSVSSTTQQVQKKVIINVQAAHVRTGEETLEELRLQKNRMEEMEKRILLELDVIRRQAEDEVAPATTKTLKSKPSKCTIS